MIHIGLSQFPPEKTQCDKREWALHETCMTTPIWTLLSRRITDWAKYWVDNDSITVHIILITMFVKMKVFLMILPWEHNEWFLNGIISITTLILIHEWYVCEFWGINMSLNDYSTLYQLTLYSAPVLF